MNRYEGPHDWLQKKVLELEGRQDAAALRGILVSLLDRLDAEDIQDIFGKEMEADGYYQDDEEITGAGIVGYTDGAWTLRAVHYCPNCYTIEECGDHFRALFAGDRPGVVCDGCGCPLDGPADEDEVVERFM